MSRFTRSQAITNKSGGGLGQGLSALFDGRFMVHMYDKGAHSVPLEDVLRWIESAEVVVILHGFKEQELKDPHLIGELLSQLGENRDDWKKNGIDIVIDTCKDIASGKKAKPEDGMAPDTVERWAINAYKIVERGDIPGTSAGRLTANQMRAELQWQCSCATNLLYTVLNDILLHPNGYFMQLLGGPMIVGVPAQGNPSDHSSHQSPVLTRTKRHKQKPRRAKTHDMRARALPPPYQVQQQQLKAEQEDEATSVGQGERGVARWLGGDLNTTGGSQGDGEQSDSDTERATASSSPSAITRMQAAAEKLPKVMKELAATKKLIAAFNKEWSRLQSEFDEENEDLD